MNYNTNLTLTLYRDLCQKRRVEIMLLSKVGWNDRHLDFMYDAISDAIYYNDDTEECWINVTNAHDVNNKHTSLLKKLNELFDAIRCQEYVNEWIDYLKDLPAFPTDGSASDITVADALTAKFDDDATSYFEQLATALLYQGPLEINATVRQIGHALTLAGYQQPLLQYPLA